MVPRPVFFIALCSVLSPYYNNFAKVTREPT